MTYKYERKINKTNVYILTVTVIALVFIIAFAYENHCKNEMMKSYEREIKGLENKTMYLKDEKRNVKFDELQRLYEDLKEEYNELYEESK